MVVGGGPTEQGQPMAGGLISAREWGHSVEFPKEEIQLAKIAAARFCIGPQQPLRTKTHPLSNHISASSKIGRLPRIIRRPAASRAGRESSETALDRDDRGVRAEPLSFQTVGKMECARLLLLSGTTAERAGASETEAASLNLAHPPPRRPIALTRKARRAPRQSVASALARPGFLASPLISSLFRTHSSEGTASQRSPPPAESAVTGRRAAFFASGPAELRCLSQLQPAPSAGTARIDLSMAGGRSPLLPCLCQHPRNSFQAVPLVPARRNMSGTHGEGTGWRRQN
jgi:hypothetical protein